MKILHQIILSTALAVLPASLLYAGGTLERALATPGTQKQAEALLEVAREKVTSMRVTATWLLWRLLWRRAAP